MQTKKIKKLARTLLATSCLTAAAEAATITETTDFSNNPGAPTVLPGGTTGVTGSLTPFSDNSDTVEIQGLTPGVNTFTSSYNNNVILSILNSSGGFITSPFASSSNGGPNTVTVPGDGILRLAFGIESAVVEPYSFEFASGVPEPGTVTGAALGLAALAAARLKNSKK